MSYVWAVVLSQTPPRTSLISFNKAWHLGRGKRACYISSKVRQESSSSSEAASLLTDTQVAFHHPDWLKHWKEAQRESGCCQDHQEEGETWRGNTGDMSRFPREGWGGQGSVGGNWKRWLQYKENAHVKSVWNKGHTGALRCKKECRKTDFIFCSSQKNAQFLFYWSPLVNSLLRYQIFSKN